MYTDLYDICFGRVQYILQCQDLSMHSPFCGRELSLVSDRAKQDIQWHFDGKKKLKTERKERSSQSRFSNGTDSSTQNNSATN